MQNLLAPAHSGPLHPAQLDVQEDALSRVEDGADEAKNVSESEQGAISAVTLVVRDALNWCS